MTLDEAMAKATQIVDAHWQRQADQNLLTMIACGHTQNDVEDFAELQEAHHAVQRVEVLAQIRQWLLDAAAEERDA